ncbi:MULTISPECIES: ABC transporter ATP-binding protein [Virgibacillus]|uniref:ATP-binding cassette domain-containing protein n=1 Tax=Virgibacillus dokdonensis TaxID=302167 RepID=A0ABU7VCM6_9BACI|nr:MULTISPECIES: ATP-binding cassette domain-containing protein [Virgibacillus]
MLQCENIGFSYDNQSWLFEGVYLTVKPGKVVGISGMSGCGKTTLAKVLAGHLPYQKGRILINQDIVDKKDFNPVQLILQHSEKSVNPYWKMKDILAESYIPSMELLEQFGIKEEWLSRWPIELSGGELQRFSIVRALHLKTKYIIADEITTMFDSITQVQIWRALLNICQKRKLGLIVISHEMDILTKICDEIYTMQELKKSIIDR